MAKRLLTFCFLSAATFGLLAQDSVKFVSVRPSPLVQASLISPNETYFKGQARISGNFEVLWDPPSEEGPGYFRVLFRPDRASREILPHDSERGPVREIWLRNTETAIRVFLTPAQRKALVSSRTHRSTGQVIVLIRSYRTGVDCDQRGYNAILVSTLQPPSHVLADAPTVERVDGC